MTTPPPTASARRGNSSTWDARLRRARLCLDARTIDFIQILRRLTPIRYRPCPDRIEIDITYACNLGCANCNRSSTQLPDGALFSVEQIEKFVAESIARDRRWKRIRVLGGEPTLHPHLMEILSRLIAFRRDHSPRTRIVLTTNGYGPRVESVLDRLPREVIVENTGKKASDQLFDTFNVAPVDRAEYAGADFSRACPFTHYCGLGLSRHGYYPCAVGAGIDRVFGLGLGRAALPRRGDKMNAELSAMCRLCGHFKWGGEKSDRAVLSKTWRQAYARAEKQRPRLPIY